MRNLRFVILGLTALLLVATQGLTQYDRRGGGGRGRGDPSDFFNRLSNGKDVIIRSELDPPMQGMFDRMAERMKITNGQMTREQFMNYQEIRRAERFGGSPPPMPSSPSPAPAGPPGAPADQGSKTESQSPADLWAARAEESFRRYDTNGDGYLNYDEMPPELRQDRDRWDTDHNGLIDLEEYKAYYQARMQQRASDRAQAYGYSYGGGRDDPRLATSQSRQKEAKPVVYRHDTIPKELAWFKLLDTDRDGQVGLYEWRAAGKPIEEFLAMDRNNDGFLTVDEVLRYQAEHNKSKAGRALASTGGTTVVASTGPDEPSVVAGYQPGGNAAGFQPGGNPRGRGPGRGRPGR